MMITKVPCGYKYLEIRNLSDRIQVIIYDDQTWELQPGVRIVIRNLYGRHIKCPDLIITHSQALVSVTVLDECDDFTDERIN